MSKLKQNSVYWLLNILGTGMGSSKFKFKFNTKYVFLSPSGLYRVLWFAKRKHTIFVRMTFSDAFEAIDSVYDMSKFPQKYFEWDYHEKFKDILNTEWECLGEL